MLAVRHKPIIVLVCLALVAAIFLATRVLPRVLHEDRFATAERVLDHATELGDRRVVWREQARPEQSALAEFGALDCDAGNGYSLPRFSRDGRWLVFAAASGGAPSDLYLAQAEHGTIGDVRALPLANTAFDERCATFVPGGLVFASNRPGGVGGFDLYRMSFDEGACSEPELIESANSPFDELDPAPGAGRGDLLFASDRHGSGLDLYALSAGGVTRLEHTDLGGDEREPALTPDGAQLYFSARFGAGFDLWRCFATPQGFLAPTCIDELCGNANERAPQVLGSGLEVDFARQGAPQSGPKSQLGWLRGESAELARLPAARAGWYDLVLMGAILLLAILVALSERFRLLDPLWKFYLLSILAHLLFLWLTRHMGLGRGSYAPSSGESPTFQIRMLDDGRGQTHSLSQVERGGELEMVASAQEAPDEPLRSVVAAQEQESEPELLQAAAAPAAPALPSTAQAMDAQPERIERRIEVEQPKEAASRASLAPPESQTDLRADARPLAQERSALEPTALAQEVSLAGIERPSPSLPAPSEQAQQSAATERLPETSHVASSMDATQRDRTLTPAPAMAAPNETLQRASLGAGMEPALSAVLLEGPALAERPVAPNRPALEQTLDTLAGARGVLQDESTPRVAASETVRGAPFASAAERAGMTEWISRVDEPAERIDREARVESESGLELGQNFTRSEAGGVAKAPERVSAASSGASLPSQAAPGPAQQPRAETEVATPSKTQVSAQPRAILLASEWSRPMSGPSEGFEPAPLDAGRSTSLIDAQLPAPDLALRPGVKGLTASPERAKQATPASVERLRSSAPAPAITVAQERLSESTPRPSVSQVDRPSQTFASTRLSSPEQDHAIDPVEDELHGKSLAATLATDSKSMEQDWLGDSRSFAAQRSFAVAGQVGPTTPVLAGQTPATQPLAETRSAKPLEVAKDAATSRAPVAAAAQRTTSSQSNLSLSTPAKLEAQASASRADSAGAELAASPMQFERQASSRQGTAARPRAIGSLAHTPDPSRPTLSHTVAQEARPESPASRLDSTPYRMRFGTEKEVALREGGGGEDTERAVALGLLYLSRIQRPNGSFGDKQDYDRKYKDTRVGKTSLCLLAFMGAGHVPGGNTAHTENVERALQFLLSIQDPETGHFGDSEAYSHGTATYALGEAYALTKDQRLLKPLRLGIDRILAQQLRRSEVATDGGWGYYYPDGSVFDRWPRASITAWQVMALESARLGGMEVPDESFQRAKQFLAGSWDDGMGAFRYSHDPARLNLAYPTLPGSTPAALFALSLLGEDLEQNPWDRGVEYVASRAPREFAMESDDAFVHRGSGNLYFWYYGSLVLFRVGGEPWQRWNAGLKETLLPAQEPDGSWAPIEVYARYAGDDAKDRSYTTAMCVLSLEVYYRYFTPLLQVR